MNESSRRCLTWSMLALAGISTMGCILVFAVRSATVQNAACIMSCAGIGAVIVHRLNTARDVVNAALRLAEEMARLGCELPDGTAPRKREAPHLAAVSPLPGQRAAVGQGIEPSWYEDRQ